jgi:hypothetical protein
MSESYYSFEKFCSLLNNQNILKEMPALVVQGNLESCVTNIKFDVLKDLLKLDNYKINVYLDLKLNEIKKQDYLKGFSSKKIERWLEYFKVELDDILAFNVDSDSFKDLVGGYYLNHNIESVDDDKIEDYKIAKEAQEAFLYYFLNYYANQLISFLELKKITTPEAEIKKTNQLTANQIVLMLQEIGFFTHPKIEDASKVKQADLISLITGIHNKTIKNNIEKLDKSPAENGANYQKDIDLINKILDDST